MLPAMDFRQMSHEKFSSGSQTVDDGLVFCFEITSDGIFLSELFQKSLNLLQKKVITKTGLIQSRPNFYSKLIFIILIYIQIAIE